MITTLKELKKQCEWGKRIIGAAQKGDVIGYSLVKILENTIPIIAPVFYYILVNNVVKEKKIEDIICVILGYAGIFLFETIIKIKMKVYSNRLFQISAIKIKNSMLKKYFEMDKNSWAEQNIGDLKKRIDNDVDNIEEWFNNLYMQLFGMLSVGIISIILLKIRIDLSIICFMFLPISFKITQIVKKHMEVVQNKYDKKLGDFEGDFFDNLQAIDEIKSNQLEDVVLKEFDREWNTLSDIFVEGHMYWFINRTIIAFKDNFVTKIGIYFIGGVLVIYKSFDIAALLLFMEYYERMIGIILSLVDNSVNLAKTGASLSRVCEILDMPSMKVQNLFLEGNIHMKNVCYQSGSKFILNDINLDINRGEKVAIMGESGSGKSTLVKVMFGILKASTGEIMMDNLRLSDYSGEIVFDNLGIVMQDNYFINDTVRNNFKLVKYNIKDQEMLEVCKKVNLNLGEAMLDIVIGENGNKLSGGQRQKLALARLLIRNPQYLVLDEATSALDKQAESEMLRMISENYLNATYIVIAHKMSAINGCNRRIILVDGKCVLDEHLSLQEDGIN